jgi:hypothetical protein
VTGTPTGHLTINISQAAAYTHNYKDCYFEKDGVKQDWQLCTTAGSISAQIQTTAGAQVNLAIGTYYMDLKWIR